VCRKRDLPHHPAPGEEGKALKKALGRKLKVKVRTPKTLLFPDTARITGQVNTG